MNEPMLHRLLGGTPAAVLLRLAFLSLLVGASLSWLGIDAFDLVVELRRLAAHLYGAGFDAVRQAWRYFAAGAALVVPIWVVVRLLSFRGDRAPPAGAPPEPLPGSPDDGLRTRSTDWRRRNGPTASAS